MEDDPEAKSYLQTEFFFYLLTSYYAIVALSIRYHKVMKELPERNAPSLPAQAIISCFQSQSQNVPGLEERHPPASYQIKTRLCLLNGYLYLFMFMFSFVGIPEVFFACKHKKYAFIYLFGFIAWMMAAFLLRREYQRNLPQSLWCHRFFWIFSAAFAITKMFEDYLLVVNFLLNIISISSNFVLGVYGVYRPDDGDTISIVHNEDIPGFVKIFFESIQLNPWVARIFQIKQPENQNGGERIEADEVDQLDLKFLDESFKVTNESRREEINLLNTLPRRNIFIDKKMQYLKNNSGNARPFFFILTQIGVKRFESSRSLEEFIKLDQDLSEFFSDKNFPKVTFPKLKNISDEHPATRYEVLEQWLTEIMKKPIFMIQPLMEFLSIDEESSNPFQTYFDYSFRSFCSRSFMISQLKKNKQNEDRRSLVGYFEEERSTVKINTLINEPLQFIVSLDEEVSGATDYGFEMTCIRKSKKGERLNWKIRKNYDQMMGLNQRIEEECKLSVSFYYQMVTHLGSKNIHFKREAFRNYLQRLLQMEQYYCPSLFQFIRFDPISVEVKILGTRIELSQAQLYNNQKRNSHYFQQYELTDQFIEIVRVDRLSPGSFKFKVKRRGFTFVRMSSQIEILRKELADIYQGVCFVPKIEYTDDYTKQQAKQRTQSFLKSIENLPKISINQCVIDFYHNMF